MYIKAAGRVIVQVGVYCIHHSSAQTLQQRYQAYQLNSFVIQSPSGELAVNVSLTHSLCETTLCSTKHLHLGHNTMHSKLLTWL